MNFDFTNSQIERYSRHIILSEVGGIGQKKLLDSKVLIIGAGGLGSPLVLYLAAAGVGNITIIDDDYVELSNLQRQIAHDSNKIGQRKAESAVKLASAINPEITITPIVERFNHSNALDIIKNHDIVADGSDNFETRFLTADTCYFMKKTLVSAAILRFEGQIATWKGYNPSYPCYRCLFPDIPPPDTTPTCSQAGIFGALAGTIGTIQAMEVIKEILEIGSLTGKLLLVDSLYTEVKKIKVNIDKNCKLCSANPNILNLDHHAKQK